MMFCCRNVYILFAFVHSALPHKPNYVEVSLTDGRICGRKVKSNEKKTYCAFQDIPYATPPVGNLRFQEPLPVKKWTGILNTTENKKICHQVNPPFEDPRQTEDCLVLNVYTPIDLSRNKVKSLPVLVWIHGGIFQTGNGGKDVFGPDYFINRNIVVVTMNYRFGPFGRYDDLDLSRNKVKSLPVLVWIHGGIFQTGNGGKDVFGPDYFINRNIVVVTMNYRFGPFGFMSTEDCIIPDNLALKDQQLALKWVQKNIGTFGGDPSKVTLMGQGYGGDSVGYHLMNRKSEGLFRSAIIQSSSPLTCFALQKHPKYVAYQLGSRLSKEFDDTKSSKELLDILQSATVEDIKKHSTIEMPRDKWNCQKSSSRVWAPTKEKKNDKNAIVTGMNHENIKNGNVNKIPLLIGINSQEVLTFGVHGLAETGKMYDDDVTLLIVGNLNMKDRNKFKAGTKIKNIYTNGNFKDDAASVMKYKSDSVFNTPIARHAYLQSKYTDVFFYQFSYNGRLGHMNNTLEGAEGVGHAEELKYLFRDSTNGEMNQFPPEDVLTHRRLIDLWTQFIKYMNPTKHPSKLTNNITWPKVTQEEFFYMDINSDLRVAVDPKKYQEYSKIYAEYADEEFDTY